jgi:ribonuclease HI
MKNVVVHTDGACSGNPGPGGWGAILQYNGHQKELSGASDGTTTNNRMELQAVAEALSALQSPCSVVVKSDSRYVVSSMMIYMHDWSKNGWRKKNGQLVVHSDLWQRIYDLCQTHKVFPLWVPGHAGDPLNERADALAKAAIPA